jgi:hypothetical protein
MIGIIEISKITGGKAEYFTQVREAAFAWDGTGAIRPVGVAR